MVGPHLVTTNADDGQPSLTALAIAVDVAVDALDRLGALAVMARMLEVEERVCVAQARSAGVAWAAIGERLGVTKQSAAKRFGPESVRDPGETVPVKVPRGPGEAWDVTTRGGRTLLRFVRQPARRPVTPGLTVDPPATGPTVRGRGPTR